MIERVCVYVIFFRVPFSFAVQVAVQIFGSLKLSSRFIGQFIALSKTDQFSSLPLWCRLDTSKYAPLLLR